MGRLSEFSKVKQPVRELGRDGTIGSLGFWRKDLMYISSRPN